MLPRPLNRHHGRDPPHRRGERRLLGSDTRRQFDRTAAFDAAALAGALRADLRDDLLPGWPELWLVPERERFHQLRLHALEALCARLTGVGWHGAAVDAGLAVVSADPLRESARGALIDAYLAEGNAWSPLRPRGPVRGQAVSQPSAYDRHCDPRG